MQQYEWFVGQIGDSVALHFWRLQALGNTHVRGYVSKQGHMALVKQVDVIVTHDTQHWQKRYSVRILDDAGRETKVETEVFAHGKMHPDAEFTLRIRDSHQLICQTWTKIVDVSPWLALSHDKYDLVAAMNGDVLRTLADYPPRGDFQFFGGSKHAGV